MRYFILFIASLFLFSCVEENELDALFPTHLFNANSSKVWILSESTDLEFASVPETIAFRTCFIFFDNRSFREQELINLGSTKGEVGKYNIKEDMKGDYILYLYYSNSDKESLRFTIRKIERKELKIQRDVDSYSPAIWTLNTLEPPLR